MKNLFRPLSLSLFLSVLLVGLFGMAPVAEASSSTQQMKTTLSAGPGYAGAKGEARYLAKGTTRSFQAGIKGSRAVANQTLGLYVDDVQIGSVKANRAGVANFKAETKKGQAVPNVVNGSRVEFRIGATVVASGVFVTPVTPVTLKISLSGSTDYVGVRGGGEYKLDKSGKASLKLDVKHLSAFAGDTVDLVVDGARIGAIEIDSVGKGQYLASTTARTTVPAINSGSVVVIESFEEPVADGEFGKKAAPTQTLKIKATLLGSADYPTARGETEYDIDKRGDAEFELGLKNLSALAGQSLDVYVDGLPAASAVVSTSGQLTVKLESEKGAVVPMVTSTSIVSVQLGGVVVAAGQYGSTGGGGGDGQLPEKWAAKLTAGADYPGARGEAEYEASDGEQELEVKVKSVPGLVGQSLDVYVDAQLAGTLVVNSNGEAKLELETEDGDVLPALTPTSTVSVQFEGVEVVAGQFAGPTGNDDDDDDDDGDDNGGGDDDDDDTVTQLQTTLLSAGSFAGAEGQAEYEEDALGNREFEVEIKDAIVDVTVSIYVDSVLVGELTLDDDGEGKFSIKSSNGDTVPTVTVGSVVEIELGGEVVFSGQF